MARRCSGILAFAASFVWLVGAAHASIVTNGSFEVNGFNGNTDTSGSENVNVGDSTTLNGWTVVGQPGRMSPITWIDNMFGLTASDGNYFLDLTGPQNGKPYGGVSQTLTTTAGDVYKLTFDLGYSNEWGTPDGITATAGGTTKTFLSPTTTSDNLWMTETMFFTASGSSTTLSLIGEAGNAYIGLDNVAVNFDHVAATPLPGALPLFAGGFGILGLMVGRKKRKAAMAAIA